MTVADHDELRHPAGPSSAWTETWEFRAATPDRGLAVAVAVVRRPAERRVSYCGVVTGRGRPTIVALEHEIDLPRSGLELRGSGIWADHVCETPHEHWSIGLEAFGLAIDEPDDLVTSGRGLPTPLGFDLEWETPDPPDQASPPGDRGYLSLGTAHGEVLVGEEALTIEGPGQRFHRWGTGRHLPEWWTTDDAGGLGNPPWTFAEVVRLTIPDPSGRVTALVVGQRLDTDRVGPAVWVSSGLPIG